MISLIAVCVAIYGIASIMEAFEAVSAVIAPIMTSNIGILVTVAVTAWITFGWYRARHSA